MFCARRGKRGEGEMEGWLASVLNRDRDGEVVSATEREREREREREENTGKAFVPTTVFFARLTRWKCRGKVHARLLRCAFTLAARRTKIARGNRLREKCPRKKRRKERKAINFNWEQHVDALYNPLENSHLFFFQFSFHSFFFVFLFLVFSLFPPFSSLIFIFQVVNDPAFPHRRYSLPVTLIRYGDELRTLRWEEHFFNYDA